MENFRVHRFLDTVRLIRTVCHPLISLIAWWVFELQSRGLIMPNLSILNNDIRQQKGLFCLNDLHKAAGNSPKHQPANFIRLDQTQGLITEIESSSDVMSCAVSKKNGVGTYACKELVYAYAMWINPAFYLQVIRVFDQSTSGHENPQTQIATDKTAKPRQFITTIVDGQLTSEPIDGVWLSPEDRLYIEAMLNTMEFANKDIRQRLGIRQISKLIVPYDRTWD